ncbi:MAG TPA: hypothetical protein VGK67_24990 [Myxococcales bacterium]
MDCMDKSRVASGIEFERVGRLKNGRPRHREGAKKSLGALGLLGVEEGGRYWMEPP